MARSSDPRSEDQILQEIREFRNRLEWEVADCRPGCFCHDIEWRLLKTCLLLLGEKPLFEYRGARWWEENE